jgi:hypothetical protein
MAHGGRRPGAGRKKGQVSKQTEVRKAIAMRALSAGLSPLDYMLSILRDETQEQSARFNAAKEAAPYVHPRLAAVEHKTDPNEPIVLVNRIELVGG